MKCPHCSESFHANWDTAHTAITGYMVRTASCPSCGRPIMQLGSSTGGDFAWRLIVPPVAARTPLPEAVPAEIVSAYHEAEAVLPVSAKASAALSRRLLQHLLRTLGNVKHSNLAREIAEAGTSLPSHLAEAIDGVRHYGNFAAHPTTSGTTGEIVEVEPTEAEWLLETIGALIDFYIVAPSKLAARKDALNLKLTDAGKRPMTDARSNG